MDAVADRAPRYRTTGMVAWLYRHARLYLYELIAAEISRATRYYDRVVQLGEGGLDDQGELLERVECGQKTVAATLTELRAQLADPAVRSAALFHGTFNYSRDIQGLLQAGTAECAGHTRVIGVFYNPYYAWLFRLASKTGLRRGRDPGTFVTMTDLLNIGRLSGLTPVRIRPAGYVPWRLLGIGTLVNRVLPMVPLIRRLALTHVVFMRRTVPRELQRLTVIVPARNERDNIEPVIGELLALKIPIEIVFVEGHSRDGTWQEIERVRAEFGEHVPIQAFRQPGEGKADAVRFGASHATGDALCIFDADRSMPAETIARSVVAYRTGVADFINGSRLVYPMEGSAMPFLNRIANSIFAKLIAHAVDLPIGDSLCGTKFLGMSDYRAIMKWRTDFGDVDPFGDFDLLFGAASLALASVDVPYPYRARTYGSTNIHRWRHGAMLLRMVLLGFVRIKAGAPPRSRARTIAPSP